MNRINGKVQEEDLALAMQKKEILKPSGKQLTDSMTHGDMRLHKHYSHITGTKEWNPDEMLLYSTQPVRVLLRQRKNRDRFKSHLRITRSHNALLVRSNKRTTIITSQIGRRH